MKGIHEEEALCLKIEPVKKKFEGEIYILTNKYTASTCEPIVYALQQQGLATVIGEKTAGAMLNSETFDLINGFCVVIPTADYYTSDGYHIDKQGVNPDFYINSKLSLEYAMKLIEKRY